jgi:hypothetical protein
MVSMTTARTITIRTALDAGGPATYREVNPPSDTTRFVRAVIPMTSLRVEEMAMCEALAHVRGGAVSETPDEAAFVCSIDEQYDALTAFVAQSGTDFSQFTFEVCDGHHRIAAAMLDGHTHIVVDIDLIPDDEPLVGPYFDFATTCPHTGSKPCNTCGTCHYNACPAMFGGNPERPNCGHQN